MRRGVRLLMADVLANRLLIPTNRRHKMPQVQKCFPTKPRVTSLKSRAIQISLVPFRNPSTEATEYFGGIEITIAEQMLDLPFVMLCRLTEGNLCRLVPELLNFGCLPGRAGGTLFRD